MYRSILFSIFFIIFFSNAFAIELKNNIDIEADIFQVDEETGLIIAQGNVTVKKDDMSLWTEKIIYNKKTDVINIPGDFKFFRDFVADGKGLTYNIEEKKGYLEEGNLYFLSDDPTKKRFFSGKNITLLDRESALIEEGIASSCEGEEKDWYIKGKNLRVIAGQYLTGRNVTLKFYEFPLFYTPYFIAPVKTERESGLLFPIFGLSGEHGFLLKQPIYLVINDSNDLTTTIRLRSKNTFGLENQYRYMLSMNETGELNLNLLHNYDQNKLYYLINWKHRTNEDYIFDADISYFNPKNYFKEYEDDSDLRNIPYVRSTAFIEKSIDREILEADLFLAKRALIPSKTMPYQKIEIQDVKLIQEFKGFFYNYDISVAGFSDDNNQQYIRGIFDAKSFFIKNLNIANPSLDLNLRYNAYSRSYEKGEFANKSLLTFIPSSIFDKGYVVNEKYIVLNTLTPSLYIPISLADQNTKVLDYKDSFDKSKKLTINYEEKWYDALSLEQFFYVLLSQSYLFTERPKDSPFSNLSLTLRYTKKIFSLFSEAEYSHNLGKIEKTLIGANFNSDFTKISLSYNFRYRLDEFLSMDLWQKITEKWAITGKLRYNIDGGDMREISIGAEFKKNCYSLAINFIRKTLPTEYLILFNLNLYGLGEIKQSL